MLRLSKPGYSGSLPKQLPGQRSSRRRKGKNLGGLKGGKRLAEQELPCAPGFQPRCPNGFKLKERDLD